MGGKAGVVRILLTCIVALSIPKLSVTHYSLTAGREVEVIGTPEKASDTTSQKGKADHRVSCRALGEADHEGWLAKKGMCRSDFIFYL